MFLLLILFLSSVPSALAMHSERRGDPIGCRGFVTVSNEKPGQGRLDTEEDEENFPPNGQILRSKLPTEDVQNIVDKLLTSRLDRREGTLIIEAARSAAGLTIGKKRQRSQLEPTPPRTPPKHARGKILIGKRSDAYFYGSETPARKRQRVGRSFRTITRNVSERAVYTWVMVKEHSDHLIESEDLIDVEDFLPKGQRYNDDDINRALLNVEVILRTWIRDMDNFVFRTVYVGLSEDAESRVAGHRSDLKNQEKIMARKNTFADLAGDAGYNLRMRPLLHHVPTELLPLFECLVAKLFSSQICSASTIIGNNAAWARLKVYWERDERIKKLQKAGLNAVAEERAAQIFLRAKLGYQLDDQ